MSREELAVLRARRTFQTGKTKLLEFRLQQLKNLLRFITERRKDIAAAVKKDLGKVSWQLQEKCGKVLKVTWQKSRQGPIRLCPPQPAGDFFLSFIVERFGFLCEGAAGSLVTEQQRLRIYSIWCKIYLPSAPSFINPISSWQTVSDYQDNVGQSGSLLTSICDTYFSF